MRVMNYTAALSQLQMLCNIKCNGWDTDKAWMAKFRALCRQRV